MVASLTGSQEVPGPGDPDGSGRAEINIHNAEFPQGAIRGQLTR